MLLALVTGLRQKVEQIQALLEIELPAVGAAIGLAPGPGLSAD